MKKQLFRSILRCALILTLLLPAWLAWDIRPAEGFGGIIDVTRLDDPTPNGCSVDGCSLREAIILANEDSGEDAIFLIAGEYYIEQPGADDNALVGDLDILYPLQLIGPGKDTTTIYSFNFDRVFSLINAGVVSMSGITIYAAYQPNKDGGGIHCVSSTLNLNNMKITNFDSSGNSGGAIFNQSCTVTLNRVNITENLARYGGGLYAINSTITINQSYIDRNFAIFDGGGVRTENSSLTIDSSLIDSNIALNNGGGIFSSSTPLPRSASMIIDHQENERGDGGVIPAIDGVMLKISNSTISGNKADLSGGGIVTNMMALIEHSTISSNLADNDSDDLETGTGGGLYAYGGATVSVGHSILANNDLRSTSIQNDCDQNASIVTSLGYNLVESPDPCAFNLTGDILAQDPNLGPLQANGGPTNTHALLPGSPAIDAGNPGLTRPPVAIPLNDQRGVGFPRVVNGRIDIGAFESWVWTFLPVVFR